ncbi:hypothetical protein ACFX15_039074 [Malus domestica]
MEKHDDGIDNLDTTSSWTSATTWTVAGGSLTNCVSFESSSSLIDDDTPNSTPTSTLILHPPSPDSGPCEITINFTQKHDIQQVYVRSTAREYEIYYAPDIQSGNEYLCTVLCGIAARDEQMLHTGDNDQVCPANSNESLKDPSEAKSRNGNSPNNSEDDCVEVKVLDTKVLDNKINLSQLKLGSAQDFYEATAQISDASPCVSLTLHLLSLEGKDCVCVGEVYVFADPVDSSDSENQVSAVENSAGSSLMAMLVPTLLQFSKTRGANRTQDKPISDTWGKQNSLATGSKETDSTSVATKIQERGKASIPDHQEVKIPDFNKASTSTAQVCIPSGVESDVDQLYSRMGRIEDLFLRFEEKMLKPINRIEARLERVEQQLEVLANKSQNSGLPTCTRFYASSFSCNESESNSCYNSGNDYYSCEAFESGKDIQPDAPLITAYEMSASVNSTHSLPSLVVTAPEFFNGDDDEDDEDSEDHGSEVVIGSSEKPRPALTIDDAQTLSVKAPDVLNEEDGNVERKELTREEHEVGTYSSMCLGETDVTEYIKGSLADLTKSSSDGEGNVIRSPNDEHTDQSLRVDGPDQHSEGGEEETLDDYKSIENAVDPANGGMSRTDFCQITEDIENGDVSIEISNTPDPDNTDVQNQLPQRQTDDGYDDTEEDADRDSDLTLPKEDSYDFSLEALLAEFPESVTEAPSFQESDDVLPIGAEGCDLILVEDGEPVGAAPDGNFSVDMNLYSLGGPSSLWGDHTCNSHETFAASLI